MLLAGTETFDAQFWLLKPPPEINLTSGEALVAQCALRSIKPDAGTPLQIELLTWKTDDILAQRDKECTSASPCIRGIILCCLPDTARSALRYALTVSSPHPPGSENVAQSRYCVFLSYPRQRLPRTVIQRFKSFCVDGLFLSNELALTFFLDL